MIYAHSLKNVPKNKWQPLTSIFRLLQSEVLSLQKGFQSGEWARCLGSLHDRQARSFQRYLERCNDMTDSEMMVLITLILVRCRLGHNTLAYRPYISVLRCGTSCRVRQTGSMNPCKGTSISVEQEKSTLQSHL